MGVRGAVQGTVKGRVAHWRAHLRSRLLQASHCLLQPDRDLHTQAVVDTDPARSLGLLAELGLRHSP